MTRPRSCSRWERASTKRKPDMNKAELIDAVSSKTGLQKAEATRAVDAVFDAVTGALKAGDSVSLLGFGTFVVKARAARTGRNPRTNEPIEIPATKVPGFKAGKALKDAVN
nr:HU family DNA-binding protein [uncultured Steroidobacter sp.]